MIFVNVRSKYNLDVWSTKFDYELKVLAGMFGSEFSNRWELFVADNFQRYTEMVKSGKRILIKDYCIELWKAKKQV